MKMILEEEVEFQLGIWCWHNSKRGMEGTCSCPTYEVISSSSPEGLEAMLKALKDETYTGTWKTYLQPLKES